MKKIIILLAIFNYLNFSLSQENHTPLFKIYENGLYGYIDSTGAVIIPPKYKGAGEFSEGLAPVRENGYYGYIDETGKYVINPIYDYCAPFNQGLGRIYLNGKVNFINKEGFKLIDFNYNDATDFESGIAIVSQSYNINGAINKTGKLILDTIYRRIKSRTEGVVIASIYDKDLKCEFHTAVDSNGTTIVPLGKYTQIDQYTNGFAHVQWYINNINSLANYAEGYINRQGELVFKKEPVFGFDLSKEVSRDSTFIISEYEYTFVGNGASVGDTKAKYLVNTKGEIITYLDLHRKYEFVKDRFAENDSINLFRYVNKDGKAYGDQFPYQLKTINSDSPEVLKLVKLDGKPAYINIEGECIWKQQSSKAEITKLDLDYRIESNIRNSYYSYNHLETNYSQDLEMIDFEKENISIVLTKEKTRYHNKYEGFSLYLINDLDYPVSAPSVDGALYIVLQAKDTDGKWKAIENYPSSSCGMSYVDTKINPKQYWKYSIPRYFGSYKTKIRAELRINGPDNKFITIYSNEISGNVNPAQFWRTAYNTFKTRLLEN